MTSEDCCPICGKDLHNGFVVEWSEHRCPPATYRGIDAANTRAATTGERLADPLLRPVAERIHNGGKALEETDD